MRATGGQILRCIVLVISALATGCRSNFYLSESEVAAYSGNLRSAASSVDLLDNLPDLPLTVAAREGEPVVLDIAGRHFALPS